MSFALHIAFRNMDASDFGRGANPPACRRTGAFRPAHQRLPRGGGLRAPAESCRAAIPGAPRVDRARRHGDGEPRGHQQSRARRSTGGDSRRFRGGAAAAARPAAPNGGGGEATAIVGRKSAAHSAVEALRRSDVKCGPLNATLRVKLRHGGMRRAIPPYASRPRHHAGSRLAPIRNASTARAHCRPSRIAQTTSDWPRRMSPAANTWSIEVR